MNSKGHTFISCTKKTKQQQPCELQNISNLSNENHDSNSIYGGIMLRVRYFKECKVLYKASLRELK